MLYSIKIYISSSFVFVKMENVAGTQVDRQKIWQSDGCSERLTSGTHSGSLNILLLRLTVTKDASYSEILNPGTLLASRKIRQSDGYSGKSPSGTHPGSLNTL